MTKRLAGFSLIELMVVLAIIAALMKLAAPSFKSFLASSRQTASAQNLFDAMRYAKSQAAQLNHEVRLCPLNDMTGACGISTDWASTGFKVVDGIDTSIAPYRVWATPSSYSATGTLASMQAVVFNANGSVVFQNGSSYSSSSQYLRYCDPSASAGSVARVVLVNGSGMLSMALGNAATPGAYQTCP